MPMITLSNMEESPPPQELVDWAVANMPHTKLYLPADRSWWYTKDPPMSTPEGKFIRCKCARLVGMNAFMGNFDGTVIVWLGQCVCERIIWGVQHCQGK